MATAGRDLHDRSTRAVTSKKGRSPPPIGRKLTVAAAVHTWQRGIVLIQAHPSRLF